MRARKLFKIYERKRQSGNVGYLVDLGEINGKRCFKSFALRSDAEAFQKQCTDQQAAEKPVVLEELHAATRHTILAALERLRPYGADLNDAVDFYIKHCKPPKGNVSIGEMMTDFKKVKSAAGLSTKYLETAWKSFFVPFRDYFKNCPATQVTKDQCQKYVYKHQVWNSTTIATHIRHLSVLYNFAIEAGYATLNPFEKVQRPKRGQGRSREKVMNVEAVRMYLQFALDQNYKPEVASLVLVYFCGVRVDEVDRVKWSDIRLADDPPLILIEEPKIAHQRRVNALSSNAIAWLELVQEQGSVAPKNYTDRMKGLRKRFRTYLGRKADEAKMTAKQKSEYVSRMDYKQNSARISFASYHVAMYENPSQTSLLLGHQNPALLWNTYRALVTKTDAEKYWNIYPNTTVANGGQITSASASTARMTRIAKVLASA